MREPLKEHERKCSRAFVLDTAAFLSGLPLALAEECIYTTPDVIEEVRDQESRTRLEISLESKRVLVVEPSKKTAVSVDVKGLSPTDLSVLYLALECKMQGVREVVMVTDD